MTVIPMGWTKLKGLYGLKRPFNFNVAVPFLLSTCLFTLVTLWFLFWFFRNHVAIGTALFYFFLYTACLLIISAILSKLSKLSYSILVWCSLELGLLVGGLILARHGFGGSLIPQDQTDPFTNTFIYHPLLQSVPRPNWRFTIRLDFGDDEDISQARAAGIDVASLQGQELHFVHNSLGIRGKELTAADLAKNLIFVYGGSTTYDIAVTQGETWVERLQSDLNNTYTVLNLGVPGYSTTEHLIQTAFYQNIVGKEPACAIYYVGINDIISSHIEHLDSAYADYHLLLTAERRPQLFLSKYSPLVRLLNALAVRRFDTVPPHPKILGKPLVSGFDERLEAIFTEHIKTIAAINAARGIRTVFIGQIINRSLANAPDEWRPLVKEEDVVPLTEHLKSILGGTAASIGAKYIDPGVANFAGNDFVDDSHFVERGARKFAAMVSREVGDYCQ